MERIEFCELILEAKRNSGITTSEISFKLKMLLPSLRRFEKGTHNFSVSKAIDYLKVVNSYIILEKKDSQMKFFIIEYKDIINWLLKSRDGIYTQRMLTHKVGCANGTIGNIEAERSIMSIDLLLKLVDELGFNIKIETNKG